MDGFVTSAAGVRVPGIIYGTAWKKAETERLVTLAIRHGFRGIDTACQPKHYNEAGVGAGVAACLDGELTRGDLYLQTKFTPVAGHDSTQIPYDPIAPLAKQVAQSFAVSLRNLRTDYVDCLVLHSPLPTARQTLEVWRAFERLVDSGGIRQPGISNCHALVQLEALYRSARVKPAVVQNRFHADTQYDRDIRAFCRNHGIVYQSFWTLTANPQALSSATVTGLAKTYRRTRAQILFRYLTQIGIVPLTGTRSELHMYADVSIFDFALQDSERDSISEMFAPLPKPGTYE